MNNPPQLSLSSTSLIKSRFTRWFLRALIKINRQRRPLLSSSSSSFCAPREIFQRCHRVKTAADRSLACAVGSRRAWSRAMLCKIRNQEQRRHGVVKRISNQGKKKCDSKAKTSEEQDGFSKAKELRRLVPGGETMDLCRLLDEAAHYIKCLNTQVQVMKCVADASSA